MIQNKLVSKTMAAMATTRMAERPWGRTDVMEQAPIIWFLKRFPGMNCMGRQGMA